MGNCYRSAPSRSILLIGGYVMPKSVKQIEKEQFGICRKCFYRRIFDHIREYETEDIGFCYMFRDMVINCTHFSKTGK